MQSAFGRARITRVTERLPVKPAAGTVAIIALKRLRFRHHHVVHLPVHVGRREAVMAAAFKTGRLDAAGDCLVPVRVAPIAAPQVGHDEQIVAK